MDLKKLKKLCANAGVLSFDVSGSGESLEVEVTENDAEKLHKAGLTWGGYKTGYGTWVLQAKSIDKGDWNDKTSKHHY